ncbi:riboflavin synthase [Pelagibacterium lentulum]|uniref:Riboflavin synthase n=1 Tax=Pelagibacterium lentulum TaxID=2029865 RepID=A0A916VXU1_9HYPH|nr:riboflavin synthase [Pelagibacterium lentulum]GGA51087.1 riboflavin synthase subunit alpha [Pelagibacterium lentulum]
MFTGIITDIGTLIEVDERNDGRRLRIATRYEPDGMELGASIMCEGVCLTVTDRGESEGRNWFDVFAARETLDVTRLGDWKVGRRINLERSLKVGDELGGHIVSGHVDGLATIVERKDIGDQTTYVLEAPGELAQFIAKKGSVALNGTSLTVNWVEGNRFSVHLIPHTLSATNWPDYRQGDSVNLEVDPMARYAARLLDMRSASDKE